MKIDELKRIVRRDYNAELSVSEMRDVVKEYPEVVYMYDLFSVADEFHVTKKGLRFSDGLGRIVYLYPTDTYKFLIQAIEIEGVEWNES